MRTRRWVRRSLVATSFALAAAVCVGEPPWRGGPKPCGAASTITVTVKDKLTGQPLAGAEVRLIRQLTGVPMIKMTTLSGTAIFTGLGIGMLYRIDISHEGYATKHRKVTLTLCGDTAVKRAGLLPLSP